MCVDVPVLLLTASMRAFPMVRGTRACTHGTYSSGLYSCDGLQREVSQRQRRAWVDLCLVVGLPMSNSDEAMSSTKGATWEARLVREVSEETAERRRHRIIPRGVPLACRRGSPHHYYMQPTPLLHAAHTTITCGATSSRAACPSRAGADPLLR